MHAPLAFLLSILILISQGCGVDVMHCVVRQPTCRQPISARLKYFRILGYTQLWGPLLLALPSHCFPSHYGVRGFKKINITNVHSLVFSPELHVETYHVLMIINVHFTRTVLTCHLTRTATVPDFRTALILLLLLPFHGSLDFVWDYPGKPVPER